ncbi:MAG TPA: ferredoxin reductase family protein [Solirubrobacteraceae bacterium]|nr:ferredoxin reductase family protein [Solirubrobacteraceae bacterium]
MSLTADPLSGLRAQPQGPPSEDGRRRRRWVPDVALVVVGLGLGATTGLAITAETHAELVARGGVATFVGSITGLVGMYLALVMVLLAGRIPVIERVLGLDGLLRWHKWLSPWPLTLIGLHAVFVTIGYAQTAKTGVGHELSSLLSGYPGVLTATVALGLMAAAGIVSIRAIRRRLRRETWWTIHLSMYLALALSFSHVIALGPSFVEHPVTQAVWSVVWAATAGVVIVFRFGFPVYRTLRHRPRVVEVRPEANDVVSILCEGRALDRLPAAGGQFMCWRFLQRGIWWQAHPYSLSARPTARHLRLTVKNLGDHSGGLALLKPGTRVIIEGPYGAFTADARRRERAVLIAGGIGVTAMRGLLEDLPRSTRPIVILRVSRAEDAALSEELAELTRQRGGKLHVVVGARDAVQFDARTLKRMVPGILERDVYLCGREGFVHHVVALVRSMGVPAEAVHHEAYTL